MNDSNGEMGGLLLFIFEHWEIIYQNASASLSHDAMINALFKLLDGKIIDYVEEPIYEFIVNHFKSPDQFVRKEKFLLQVMEKEKTKTFSSMLSIIKEVYYVQVLAD